MKILIFGASGSGTTTLAHHFSLQSEFHHLDSDDYYWLKSEPPFEQKRNPEERNHKLTADFNLHQNIVVSGPVLSWDEQFFHLFDLVVFFMDPSCYQNKAIN